MEALTELVEGIFGGGGLLERVCALWWPFGQGKGMYLGVTLLIPPFQRKTFLDDQVDLRSSVPQAQALHRPWTF